MPILFEQSTQCFHLCNSRVSYIFRLAGGKYPIHVHWGRRVRAVTDELIARRTIWTEETFCLNETVMDFLPMECPTFGGDLRRAAEPPAGLGVSFGAPTFAADMWGSEGGRNV